METTKEFKGTKGPWEIYGLEEDPIGVRTVQANKIKGDVICNSPNKKSENSLKNWRINAQLITAAPDMLEALQEFMKYYESDFFKLASNDGRTQAAWILKAKETIKKALGQN